MRRIHFRNLMLCFILLLQPFHVDGQEEKATASSTKSTLSFAYKESLTTPIKEEWIATITRRDKNQGTVVEQKMTETQHYEPGNYHIEINTLPKDIRNIDLDSNFVSVLAISQPGFARFVSNESNKRSATLRYQLGGKYYNFYTIDLNDSTSQHLQIQPGEYQVHYQTSATERSLTFKIKPGKETIIELK